MEERLRREATALLEQAKVGYIIGFAPGSLKFTTTPLITENQADIVRLVINPFITSNLANYLTQIKGRVGIVAKGCDSRSIVSLIQDNKVAREDLVILGVPCSGIIDIGKVERLAGRDRDELDEVIREGDGVVVVAAGHRSQFPVAEALYDSCRGCQLSTPREYDVLLSEAASPVTDLAASQAKIAVLKARPAAERWQFWKEQFGRCIRCYACRNVCPVCYCQRCFVEESEPQWLSPAPQWQDNLLFQVVRGIHVAGRCTDCGACERACPVNIPLRNLTREMYDITSELFNFTSGMDKEVAPLLTAYEVSEAEGFFR